MGVPPNNRRHESRRCEKIGWMDWNGHSQSSLISAEVQIVGIITECMAQERNIGIYNYTNFSPVITLRSATVGISPISENPVSSNISATSDIE